MSYALVMSRQARAYLSRLGAGDQTRLGRALRELQANPLHDGTKQLKGRPERAARVGGWRILYTVRMDSQELEIRAIAPRGQVYRRL